MRATGGRHQQEGQLLEGILPHLGGDLEQVGVGDIPDAGTEMRALALRGIERPRTVP